MRLDGLTFKELIEIFQWSLGKEIDDE